MPINREILSRLLAQLPQSAPQLRELHISIHWLIVNCQRYALATFIRPSDPTAPCFQTAYLGDQLGQSVLEIADRFADSDDPLRLGLITACLNGSLPLPQGVFDANAVDPFVEMIKQCPTCFIGRFPRAQTWRDQGHPVTVIELEPRKPDIHWNDSKPLLSNAEIVFITGLTLLNGTFLEVLDRTPRAKYRVLLGRTVPLSSIFFDYGIHLVGSTLVSDASLAIRYAQHGGTSLRDAPPGALRNVNITNQPRLKTELDRLNPT
jgi:uncharacterized protein (DUF4213/DUF364 family)